MLFTPKISKYKKHQKRISFNKINSNLNIFQFYKRSIKVVFIEFGSVSVSQLIAIRFLIKKSIKKIGLLKFNIFPARAISKKPAEIRMGKGKGNFSYWSCDFKAGVLLCEIFCKKKYFRRLFKLLKRVQVRIPVKTKIKI